MGGEVLVVGGGLAGSEAAWQLLRLGHRVRMLEMRPRKMTEAHRTAGLAELVCTNSLKSERIDAAHGALKGELAVAGSLLLEVARATRVPAGQALAVDRAAFSEGVSEALESQPRFTLEIREVQDLSEVDGGPGSPTLVAAGPLCSDPLARSFERLLGEEHLYFYDAIAPIVDGSTIDYSIAFWATRYGKGGADYLNCPMNQEEYRTFLDALLSAERVDPRPFEDMRFFDACQPVEQIGDTGPESLTFGPMKPVGLVDPRTDEKPYAVVQLRRENPEGTAFNLVGFQTRLTFPEQRRVFRLIPGLGRAKFLRYGSIHRNTYIHAPRHLDQDLSLKEAPGLFVAGQLSGAEGYLEAVTTGLMAALFMDARLRGEPLPPPPRTTLAGGLLRYLTHGPADGSFSPSNAHWGLVPPLDVAPRGRRARQARRAMLGERAVADFRGWWAEHVAHRFPGPGPGQVTSREPGDDRA